MNAPCHHHPPPPPPPPPVTSGENMGRGNTGSRAMSDGESGESLMPAARFVPLRAGQVRAQI